MEPIEVLPTDAKAMHEFFNQETDRGAAVLAGSYAENLLGVYLKLFITDHSLSEKIFGAHGSLSTFSQRIDFAQAFGYLSKQQCTDLHFVRKIRNHFAHHPKSASFTESPVCQWCSALSTATSNSSEVAALVEVPRHRLPFLLAIGHLIITYNQKTYGYGNPEAT